MYRLNCLDEPGFMAVPKPMLTEFGIRHRLESCDFVIFCQPSACLRMMIHTIEYFERSKVGIRKLRT